MKDITRMTNPVGTKPQTLGWKGDTVEDMYFDDYTNTENMYLAKGVKGIKNPKDNKQAPKGQSVEELNGRAMVGMDKVKFPTPTPQKQPV